MKENGERRMIEVRSSWLKAAAVGVGGVLAGIGAALTLPVSGPAAAFATIVASGAALTREATRPS